MFTEPVSFLDIVLEETGSFRSQSRGRLHRSAGREFDWISQKKIHGYKLFWTFVTGCLLYDTP